MFPSVSSRAGPYGTVWGGVSKESLDAFRETTQALSNAEVVQGGLNGCGGGRVGGGILRLLAQRRQRTKQAAFRKLIRKAGRHPPSIPRTGEDTPQSCSVLAPALSPRPRLLPPGTLPYHTLASEYFRHLVETHQNVTLNKNDPATWPCDSPLEHFRAMCSGKKSAKKRKEERKKVSFVGDDETGEREAEKWREEDLSCSSGYIIGPSGTPGEARLSIFGRCTAEPFVTLGGKHCLDTRAEPLDTRLSISDKLTLLANHHFSSAHVRTNPFKNRVASLLNSQDPEVRRSVKRLLRTSPPCEPQPQQDPQSSASWQELQVSHRAVTPVPWLRLAGDLVFTHPSIKRRPASAAAGAAVQGNEEEIEALPECEEKSLSSIAPFDSVTPEESRSSSPSPPPSQSDCTLSRVDSRNG